MIRGRSPRTFGTRNAEGRGKLTFTGAASIASETSGRLILDVDSSRGGFFLQVRTTDPADYVRNIRVIMPGFEATYEREPFHPAFPQRWKGMACFRFMDWMHTNGSKIQSCG